MAVLESMDKDEFRTCLLILYCCSGLASIGGLDMLAAIAALYWEPKRSEETKNVDARKQPDRIQNPGY